MSERVQITGGEGFIGSHLVDALVAKGHQVRVFDNLELQVHGGPVTGADPAARLVVRADRRTGERPAGAGSEPMMFESGDATEVVG